MGGFEEHFVQEFTESVQLLQQEKGGVLREGVAVDTGITGDSKYYDQLDKIEMQEVTNRHGDTVISELDTERRKLVLTPYDVAAMVDDPDKVRTLNDPTNSRVKALAMAAARKEDNVIISAFDAAVATGASGTGTAATFDTTSTIAGNTGYEIAAGGAGLTTAKCIQARAMLEASSNLEDGDENKWYIVANANARKNLLNDVKFGDADFNSIKALVHGEVDTWLGFKFLKSELLPASGNDRSIYAWCKSGMQLGIGMNVEGHVDKIPTKRHSTQIRYASDLGAIRMTEKSVVRIICDESA